MLGFKLAKQLGIKAVVAVKTYLEPPVETFRTFKNVFFKYLINGETIKEAFDQARSVVTATSKK